MPPRGKANSGPISIPAHPKADKLRGHFDQLVSYLEVVDHQRRNGGDELEACLNTLTAVRRYLQSDPHVRKMKALRNL
jgi:hypothetical protein